jgi:hypothetical protein
MTTPSQIVTPEGVREAEDSLLAERRPSEKVTRCTVRERLGGGSMGTIHKYLRPLIEEERVAAGQVGEPTSGDEEQRVDVALGPACDLVERLRAAGDELATLIPRLTDDAVAEERSRHDAKRHHIRKALDHEREQTAAEIAALREALDRTAEGSASFEQELASAKEEVGRQQQLCEVELQKSGFDRTDEGLAG